MLAYHWIVPYMLDVWGKSLLVVSILTNAYPHGILAQILCSSSLDTSIPLDCTIHVKSLSRSFSSINPNKCCMKSYFRYGQLFTPSTKHDLHGDVHVSYGTHTHCMHTFTPCMRSIEPCKQDVRPCKNYYCAPLKNSSAALKTILELNKAHGKFAAHCPCKTFVVRANCETQFSCTHLSTGPSS